VSKRTLRDRYRDLSPMAKKVLLGAVGVIVLLGFIQGQIDEIEPATASSPTATQDAPAVSSPTATQDAPAVTAASSATTTTTRPETRRNWLKELRDSFGGEAPAWAVSMTDVEYRGGYLHVYLQTDDSDHLRAACTYVGLLFDEPVQTYSMGVANVRTRLDGSSCS